MRHRLSFIALVALGTVMVVSVASCGSPSSSPGTAGSLKPQVGLTEQTTKIGDVEVKVTPTQLDSSGAAFTVVLDTHAGWEGAPSGGHHREGTLRFRAAGPLGAATLAVGGLSGPARFTWNPPPAG